MKGLIHRLFSLIGLEVRRKGGFINVSSSADKMSSTLLRLKRNEFNPEIVIDLGAAAGSWTTKAINYFPNSKFLLFEPLEERWNELKILSEKFNNIYPIFSAVGNKEGKISFVVTNDLDGSGVYDSNTAGSRREVSLVTLDLELKRRNFNGRCLIKFDTHGFELPILEGATEVLSRTDVIIMECYNFRISSDCLLYNEMISHMDKLGFRTADIVDIMHRPIDKIFWQCDITFLRKDHSFFLRNNFQ